LEIYSENLLTRVEIDTKVFRDAAAEILTSLVGPDGEASVVFVPDDKIHELNRVWRDVDRPTDVLSFSCVDDETSHGVIGDVYISLETAARQAKERGVPLVEELLRLMIHGLLHLVGHTHDGEEDGALMREQEEKFFDTQAGRVLGSAAGGGEEET